MVKPKTLLLVEDDRVLLDLNKRVLTREGFLVLVAQTFDEAREAVEKDDPQAIVLDGELPDGDIFDFCRELREAINVPIVFLTRLKGKEYEKAVYAAGADAYITKPYHTGHLADSIETLLARR